MSVTRLLDKLTERLCTNSGAKRYQSFRVSSEAFPVSVLDFVKTSKYGQRHTGCKSSHTAYLGRQTGGETGRGKSVLVRQTQ